MKEKVITQTSATENDIMTQFANQQNKNPTTEVLKELFDPEKLYMISDLSHDEIRLCTRIYMVAEMKNLAVWKEGLKFYMTTIISKNRKSRKELIEAIRGQLMNNGFFDRIKNRFGIGSGGYP